MTVTVDPVGVQRLEIKSVKRENTAWVVLRGEADIATLEDLQAALARIELSDIDSVHLHLPDLDFADVATLRQLTLFARQARHAGRDITTCGAKPILRKVAHLLGFHDDLRFS